MKPTRGLACPVLVPSSIDWERDYSQLTAADLAAMSDDQLAEVDPLAMNLVVAKGLPALAGLEIRHYQDMVNGWVKDFTLRCLPRWESHFHETPRIWANDIRYFRLGMVCQYLELEIGIQYNQNQRESQTIRYTNPSDMFLNGVLDTREGTCGNMAALQIAFGWRLGWPVSLACVNSHFILRFDDGSTTYNIEATQSGYGGFKSDPDDYLITTKKLPPIAIRCGSDLRALRPHEVLASFIGLRARHVMDVGMHYGDEALILESEPDWLLARRLFPANRILYKDQMVVSSMRGDSLFESNESGHPSTYAHCLDEIQRSRLRFAQTSSQPFEEANRQISQQAIDELFFQVEANP